MFSNLTGIHFGVILICFIIEQQTDVGRILSLSQGCKNMKKNPVLGSVRVYVPHELRQHADQRPTLLGGERAAVLRFGSLVRCWRVNWQVGNQSL